jgi:hypothetical protein
MSLDDARLAVDCARHARPSQTGISSEMTGGIVGSTNQM